LDSGSEVTLIPTSLIGNREIQGTMRQIWAVNGSAIPVKGWISLTAYINGVQVKICGLVSDCVSDVVLGHDWLLLNDVRWDFSRGEIELDGRRHRLVSKQCRGPPRPTNGYAGARPRRGRNDFRCAATTVVRPGGQQPARRRRAVQGRVDREYLLPVYGRRLSTSPMDCSL